MPELENLSQASLHNGSRTFSLASRFFSQEEFESAAKIYYWCRHCDDVIDEGPGNQESWMELKKSTFGPSTEPQFEAFRSVCHKYSIPDIYPQELLEGMRMDLEIFHYQTLDDLMLYCYRVAGTVGLMMSHVMGLYQEQALPQAAKLGMAMQLTNIARDIKEDYARGRIYLPQRWLEQEELSNRQLMDPSQREKLRTVTHQLLAQAEKLYSEASEGIIHLPIRSALAVTMARNFYREIGREIIQRRNSFADERVVITDVRKVFLLVLAFFEILLSLPHRLLQRREIISIQSTWRPT